MTPARPLLVGDMLFTDNPYVIGLQDATFPVLVISVDNQPCVGYDRHNFSYRARCLGANGKMGLLNLYRSEVFRREDLHGMSREGQVFLISGWPKPVPDGS